MSETLVTGSLGFIGQHLVRHLISLGEKPILVVRDEGLATARELYGDNALPLSVKQLEESISNLRINVVVNLAGHYVFGDTKDDAETLISSNIDFPAKILSVIAASHQKVNWVQASTFMQHFEVSEYEPTCLYAATKEAMRSILAYFAIDRLTLHDLVLPQVYGSNDTREKLLNIFIDAAKNSNQVSISSGSQIMDLVHVDDVVRAILLLRENPIHTRTQLTSEDVLTVKDLILLIEEISGNKIDVNFDASKDRQRDAYRKWIVSPCPQNWKPEINLSSWIKDVFKEIK